MTSKAISVDNVGPIDHFEFSGSKPGVTIFSGPNGIGKSIFQKAIQTLARGKGRVPLKDGAKRGKVEGFGAVITIGAKCTPSGSFDVLSLDGRWNLAELVDPRLDTPALADNARFKALIGLTGVVASVGLFRNHEAFSESFDAVVNATSTETEDLVEMARKIKKDYDDAGLAQERLAERETGHASALVAPKDLDLEDESDPKILQTAYGEARDDVTRLKEQVDAAVRDLTRVTEARKLLETLAHDELIAERDVLSASILSSDEEAAKNLQEIEVLRRKAMLLKAANDTLATTVLEAKAKIEGIGRQLVLVEQATALVTQAVTQSPTVDQITEADTRLTEAAEAVERGALIRQAIKDSEKASAHRKAASTARALAIKYRSAGKVTDEVLSSAINCPQMRAKSDGKAMRLYCDSPRGKDVLYHDESDGIKYHIAIDIGADQVGKGGLLTVDQIGWEGVDADNRIEIDRHGKERDVHIWVLEASRVPGAPREIVARPFDDSPIEPSPRAIADAPAKPNSKAIAQAALSAFHIADVNAAAHPVKTPAPKPVVKAVAQSDDIPF